MNRYFSGFFISIILVFIFSVVFIYAPNFIGEDIEGRFKESMMSLSKNAKLDGKVIEYKRGIYSSTAKSLITISAEDDDVWFYFTHKITHGPRSSSFSYGKIISTFIIPEKFKEEFEYYFKDTPPLTVLNTIHFSGLIDFSFSTPSYVGSAWNNESMNIAWNGLLGSGKIPNDSNSFYIIVRAPLFKIKQTNDSDVTYEDIVIEVNSEKELQSGVWYGGMNYTMGELNVYQRNETDPLKKKFIANNTAMKLNISPKGDFVDFGFLMSIDGIIAGDKEVRNIRMNSSVKNISKEAYEKIDRLTKNIESKGYSEEYIESVYDQAIKDILPMILGKHPSLSIDAFSFMLGENKFSSSAFIKYIGGQNLTNFDPRYDLEGNTKFSLDKALLNEMAIYNITKETEEYMESEKITVGKDISQEKVDEIIRKAIKDQYDNLLTSGYIDDEDNIINTDISLNNGNIYVNSLLANEKLGWTEIKKTSEPKKYAH